MAATGKQEDREEWERFQTDLWESIVAAQGQGVNANAIRVNPNFFSLIMAFDTRNVTAFADGRWEYFFHGRRYRLIIG